MILNQPHVDIGPYVVGEKPAPLSYTFQDSNGVPIVLTGYTVKFEVWEQDGTPVQFNAAVTDGPGGVVTYVWVGGEFPGPGHWRARFIAGNNVQRWASILLTFSVALDPYPVPNI